MKNFPQWRMKNLINPNNNNNKQEKNKKQTKSTNQLRNKTRKEMEYSGKNWLLTIFVFPGKNFNEIKIFPNLEQLKPSRHCFSSFFQLSSKGMSIGSKVGIN